MTIGVLVDSEGFGWSTAWSDYSTYGRMTALNGNPAIDTGGFDGDNYLSASSNQQSYRTLPINTKKFTMGCRLLPGSVGALYFMDQFQDMQLSIFFNVGSQDGVIQINSGGTWPDSGHVTGNNIGLSETNVFPINGQFYFEVQAVIDSSNGYVVCFVNGSQVSSASIGPVNTSQGSSFPVSLFGWQTNTTLTWMHWYFLDETAQSGAPPWGDNFGPVRVQTLLPTGAGANTDFTPHGQPTNWQNAASVPPVPGTDYNSSSTVGAIDSFSISAIDPTFGAIDAVVVKTIGALNNSGARTLASAIVSGSTTEVGTGVAIGSGPIQILLPTQLDPNTGAAWTPGAVQASNPGYKVTA